ncbi:MAG: EAL domain-containing protein [Gammaproteobacteria bacterium]|nr:EAL domain-containing protein [Gammaproteobacteria bacterium]
MTFDEIYYYTKNLTVLYVEDEADVRDSTRRILENYFLKVDIAVDGKAGLEQYCSMLNQKRYDLVITDIHMPNLGGLDMAASIRKYSSEQYIILTTTHNDDSFFLDAIKLGINAYSLKPVNLADLSHVLYQSAKNIVNQYKVIEQKKREIQKIELNERYKKALLKWSNVNFEDTDNSIKELTEISAHTLGVERVSFWLFDENSTSIICSDLYIKNKNIHTEGLVLEKKNYPKYFDALNKQNILVVNNAREDERTSEFTQDYLEPMDIYSLLDIPIIQNREFLGVICHEATKEEHHWNYQEQEFAMTLANNIALSLEIKKRYEIQEKLRIQKEKLDHQAHHDHLTGLPNRILFLDRLEQSIKKNYRNQSQVALLFIDLDRFKEINDSLGHEAGDKVLKSLSQRLAGQIRECDTLTRLGGDEFTIILDDIHDSDQVVTIIQKLYTCTQEAIFIGGQNLYITLSIGISLFPDDGFTVEALLKNADAAMYKAKDNGRNTYEFYTMEMTVKAVERMVMEVNLREAIDKKELYLNYQPQYDASNDRMIGMEALIRWNNRDCGIIPPDKFIPFAEETGLIVEVDRWVMDTSMKQFSQWYEEGLNPGTLSLNLAMKQLQNSDCVEYIESLLKKYHFCENWLEFEITEGRIMENPESSIKTLNHIKSLGVSLAIDDFGTGYSSLSYLKRLPIDTLKIDRAFIMGLPDDEEDEAITKAIIALGQSLNLNLIAEGVENQEQKKFLIEHGCDWIQGYYYSKPLLNTDMHTLLKKIADQT